MDVIFHPGDDIGEMPIGQVIAATGISKDAADLLMDCRHEAGMIGALAASLTGGYIKPDSRHERRPELTALADRCQFESEPLLDIAQGDSRP